MKPGILQLVDVVLKYFVPGVIAFAVLSFLIWTLGAWLVTGEVDLSRAIFATLAVFVMGYPCSLGLAPTLAMSRGGGRAAECAGTDGLSLADPDVIRAAVRAMDRLLDEGWRDPVTDAVRSVLRSDYRDLIDENAGIVAADAPDWPLDTAKRAWSAQTGCLGRGGGCPARTSSGRDGLHAGGGRPGLPPLSPGSGKSARFTDARRFA